MVLGCWNVCVEKWNQLRPTEAKEERDIMHDYLQIGFPFPEEGHKTPTHSSIRKWCGFRYTYDWWSIWKPKKFSYKGRKLSIWQSNLNGTDNHNVYTGGLHIYTYKIGDCFAIGESSCNSFGKVYTIRREICLSNGRQNVVIAAVKHGITKNIQCWCQWPTMAAHRKKAKENGQRNEQ